MTARIAAVDTFVVRYPVVGDFRFLPAAGAGLLTRDTVVVRVTADDGTTGWGQSIPSPTWSYETVETVQSTLDRYLGPAIVGIPVEEHAEYERLLRQRIANGFTTGQPIAKAGLDLALHDLRGRRQGHSVRVPWGRAGSEPITLSWTIDVRSMADLEPSVAAARQRGYRHFNVKIGSDPALDRLVCRELRRLAPAAFIWVDANGGYDEESARRLAPELAELGIAAFEQPFPANRLSWYARLKKQGAVPILMDEGIVSRVDLEEFHELGLLDGVALKISRCGGLTEAEQVAKYLREHGLLLFASGLTDPDLAFAASVQLLAAYELDVPAALNAPQFLHGSVLRTPLALCQDQVAVPPGIGLGVAVDEALFVQRDFIAPGAD